MARVPHIVGKRKKSKTLGEPEVISREAYGSLEMDSRLELIRALIPIGLAYVQEELEPSEFRKVSVHVGRLVLPQIPYFEPQLGEKL